IIKKKHLKHYVSSPVIDIHLQKLIKRTIIFLNKSNQVHSSRCKSPVHWTLK
ncbi:hypothetical protein L9F63_019068, partial [Diploptera punctata]